MLERIDLNAKRLTKEEYKDAHDDLIKRLIVLQQQARIEGIGLVVLLEGWNGAGKGSRVSDLMYNLDARATAVHVTEAIDQAEAGLFNKLGQGVTGYFPFMQEFWEALGPRGDITFFIRGWYARAIQRMLFTVFGSDLDRAEQDVAKKKRKKRDRFMQGFLQSAAEFEGQLVNDGYAVVKFFLHISEKEQRGRLSALYKDPATRWRVSKEELSHTSNYKQSYKLYDELLEGSNTATAPWILVNGEDKRQANLTICTALVEAFEKALGKGEAKPLAGASAAAPAVAEAPAPAAPSAAPAATPAAAEALPEAPAPAVKGLGPAPRSSRFPQVQVAPDLDAVDHSLMLDPTDYRERLKAEQARLNRLELEMYLKRIPLMLAFEGWDAAGKGGAIKRVAQALDARSYTIFPSPAPTPMEKLHPHLWRYWTRLPKAGHVGIYDRSWYGRVLVERVEGFATPAEVCRAYDEINGFEHDLAGWGALLLKFWVEISPDEQLRRFQEREADPDKQWKITDEDWRNRDKRPQYEVAVRDMFRLTSTPFAPWVILESDNKLYARVKALQIINDTLERRLREK